MFDFILGLVIGFVVAFLYWRSIIVASIERALAVIEETNEEPEVRRISVTVEQEGDQFYLYRYEDDQFVAQGKDFSEFQKILPILKADSLQIVNGNSDAAKALIAVSSTEGIIKK